MTDKIIKSDKWSALALYPYYWMKSLLFGKDLASEIETRLDAAKEKDERDIPELNRLDVRVTGSCTIITPGQGVQCREGISSKDCEDIILIAQQKNPTIWGYHRPNGRCVKH